MVAGYLHSYYSMPCLVTIGGQVVQTTIRWYKAPAGAKLLPFPTTFFPHLDDADPGESFPGEMGEVGFPRTWDPGRNPGYQGQCFRGDPAWFATGVLPPLASLPPSPCPCQLPVQQAAGGLVLAGAAVSRAGLVTTCAHCPGGAPKTWTITASGGTGNFAQFNRTFLVPYTGFCDWLYHAGVFTVELNYDFVNVPVTLTLASTAPITQANYSFGSGFDCWRGGPFVLESKSGVGNAPTSVVAS